MIIRDNIVIDILYKKGLTPDTKLKLELLEYTHTNINIFLSDS